MLTRNLEDFRLNEYLTPCLILNGKNPEEGIEMSFNRYAIHAFYSTFEDINDLETQSTFVNNGRRSSISVALWFLALEAFITCLCKIACQKEEMNFSDKLSGKSISKRLDFVFQVYNIDGIKLKQNGLVARINEFLQFRNEIFHDRNFGEKITFHKTNFSPMPFYCNQVDIFQSILIFLETVYALRYIIKEIDLMPNISISNNNVLIFEKLDVLYEKLLRPFFENTLCKHNLTTHLNLKTNNFIKTNPNSNDYFSRGEVLSIIRIEQREELKHDLNSQETRFGIKIYEELLLSYNKPVGHNDNLNFMVDWNKLYNDASKGTL